MGFDLVVHEKKGNEIVEFNCKYNVGRYSGNREVANILYEECICIYEDEFYRPICAFENCKDEVIKLNINVEFWLEFLKFIDENENIYLYDNY